VSAQRGAIPRCANLYFYSLNKRGVFLFGATRPTAIEDVERRDAAQHTAHSKKKRTRRPRGAAGKWRDGGTGHNEWHETSHHGGEDANRRTAGDNGRPMACSIRSRSSSVIVASAELAISSPPANKLLPQGSLVNLSPHAPNSIIQPPRFCCASVLVARISPPGWRSPVAESLGG